MWLTITAGEGKGLAVRIEGERFLVGSGHECRIVLHDEEVAPIHALFEIADDGDVEVQDLHTQSGTWVRGERIGGATHVRDGDEVRIGSTTLTATLEDPAQSEAVEEPAVEVTIPPEGPPSAADDEAVALLTSAEGSHIEVVPESRSRHLRERVTVATGLAAAAAALAVIAVIVVLATRGGGGDKSVADVVKAVTPSTVIVKADAGPQGQSSGSGWVLDAGKGLIVTNFHVINGGTGFTVTGQDTSGDAQVVGASPCEDLAVLKVRDTSGLKTLPLASQGSLRQGESVVAIGYPANASNQDKLTSTAGVVSVVQSSFRFDSPDSPSYQNVVQTDAALSPGNSGGPLVDRRGRLVGVNTAILTSIGQSPIEGQGYAIGVDRVKTVVADLRQGRSPGWAGFGFVFATDRQARKNGLPTKGVVISPALPGTGAAGAHIGPQGALLLSVGNHALQGTITDYCQAVATIEPGQSVPITLIDKPGAKARTASVKFG